MARQHILGAAGHQMEKAQQFNMSSCDMPVFLVAIWSLERG
jgi:hypothetical protein